MPELPEVEYVRRLLRRAMQGARIDRVLMRRPNLRYPFPPDFVSRLEGQKVLAVRRRAKYLLIDLASGDTLLMHLGMSGWFRVVRPSKASKADLKVRLYDNAGGNKSGGEQIHDSKVNAKDEQFEKHDHVVFEMSNGSAAIFNDPRRFGFMKIISPSETASMLPSIGPEPLERGFGASMLAEGLRNRKTSLKAALLDQRVVGGLGNIYVCEALHHARLSPKRKAATLVTASGAPRPHVHALVAGIRVVLKDAIRHQHRAGGEDRFQVYDAEGRRCPRRGCSGTIRRIVQAGRSTFFCPVCQR